MENVRVWRAWREEELKGILSENKEGEAAESCIIIFATLPGGGGGGGSVCACLCVCVCVCACVCARVCARACACELHQLTSDSFRHFLTSCRSILSLTRNKLQNTIWSNVLKISM